MKKMKKRKETYEVCQSLSVVHPETKFSSVGELQEVHVCVEDVLFYKLVSSQILGMFFSDQW